MTKLFVYGVNSRCPREDLEEVFGKYGEVTDVYITGKGKHKQYYFGISNALALSLYILMLVQII